MRYDGIRDLTEFGYHITLHAYETVCTPTACMPRADRSYADSCDAWWQPAAVARGCSFYNKQQQASTMLVSCAPHDPAPANPVILISIPGVTV